MTERGTGVKTSCVCLLVAFFCLQGYACKVPLASLTKKEQSRLLRSKKEEILRSDEIQIPVKTALRKYLAIRKQTGLDEILPTDETIQAISDPAMPCYGKMLGKILHKIEKDPEQSVNTGETVFRD